MKLKTYVITVSRNFPSYHPKKGTPTNFIEKIFAGEKIHTVRDNYDLWKKRIDEVNAGRAVLSLRYWTAKPYNSPQKEFAQIDKDTPLSVQACMVFKTAIGVDTTKAPKTDSVQFAANDGLSLEDFKAWFKKPSDDLQAIIHFTGFRY